MDAPKLTEQAEAAFERAVQSGDPKDVLAAVRMIYEAARATVDGRAAHEDPVVLSFLIELARKVRQIEERVGLLLVPPRPGGPVL